MKMRQYYFLASPYNGSEEEKRERYALSKKIAAMFLEHGISVFAPIIYNQALLDFFPINDLDKRRKLLMPMNMSFLHQSTGLLLLKIPGWDTSWGLQQYLKACSEFNIPIYDLDPKNLDDSIQKVIPLFQSHSLKSAVV